MIINVFLEIFCFVYSVSASIYVQAPNHVPKSYLETLIKKFAKPLQDIQKLTGEGVQLEFSIKSPDNSVQEDVEHTDMDSLELHAMRRSQIYKPKMTWVPKKQKSAFKRPNRKPLTPLARSRQQVKVKQKPPAKKPASKPKPHWKQKPIARKPRPAAHIPAHHPPAHHPPAHHPPAHHPPAHHPPAHHPPAHHQPEHHPPAKHPPVHHPPEHHPTTHHPPAHHPPAHHPPVHPTPAHHPPIHHPPAHHPPAHHPPVHPTPAHHPPIHHPPAHHPPAHHPPLHPTPAHHPPVHHPPAHHPPAHHQPVHPTPAHHPPIHHPPAHHPPIHHPPAHHPPAHHPPAHPPPTPHPPAHHPPAHHPPAHHPPAHPPPAHHPPAHPPPAPHPPAHLPPAHHPPAHHPPAHHPPAQHPTASHPPEHLAPVARLSAHTPENPPIQLPFYLPVHHMPPLQIPPVQYEQPIESKVVGVEEINKAFEDLQQRLAAGTANVTVNGAKVLAYNDVILNKTLEYLEKRIMNNIARHNEKPQESNAIPGETTTGEPCAEANIMRDAFKPVLFEDLWKYFGKRTCEEEHNIDSNLHKHNMPASFPSHFRKQNDVIENNVSKGDEINDDSNDNIFIHTGDNSAPIKIPLASVFSRLLF